MGADGAERSYRELTPQESSIIAEVIARNTTMGREQALELLQTYTVSYDPYYNEEDRLLHLRSETSTPEVAGWAHMIELWYEDVDGVPVCVMIFLTKAKDRLKEVEVLRLDRNRLHTYPPTIEMLFPAPPDGRYPLTADARRDDPSQHS